VASLFSSPANALVTLSMLALLAAVLPGLLDWAVLSARFTGAPADCRVAEAGACWLFIPEKLRFTAFGLYPRAEHWRPGAVLLGFVGATALSFALLHRAARPFAWLLRLWGVWALASVLLLAGGFLGLAVVPTRLWGGLPVSLLVTAAGIGLGLPLGILLAFARRSELPVISISAVVFIEGVRGVPLISLLIVALVMAPLFLPDQVTIDALLRATLAYTAFAAAYFAEIVRGGLQGIGRGQSEAAEALGLGPWRRARMIVLPQALTFSTPALVTLALSLVKDTSLLLVIGVFDFFNTVRTALNDQEFLGFHTEAFLYAAFVYFCLTRIVSRFGTGVEGRYRQARFGQ
jgi:general L-amino acid transport system permease protein